MNNVNSRLTVITARKPSLGQGNIFRRLCQLFCPTGGGVCVVKWGMRGKGGWGVHGKGACLAAGVHARGHAWHGGVHGKGGAYVQERWPLKRAVRILLECILVWFIH